MNARWVIAEDALLQMLRRAASGEDPGVILAEEFANSEVQEVPGAEFPDPEV